MLNTSHSHPLPLTSSSLAMSQSGHFNVPITTTTTTNSAATGDGTSTNSADPLQNLSTVLTRINSVQNFLNNSINTNTILSKTQMHIVSSEISSAIHQIIVNAAALISSSQFQPPNLPLINHPLTIAKNGSTSSISNDACYNNNNVDLKHEVSEDEINDDWEIIEIDSVELLAEHIHFCEICGKGFKRDANLRMHMRAHGDRFKSPEALVKPPEKFGAGEARRRRFSCPFAGCNRNKLSKKFRPLKSVVCVRNHFKRSHCPKMYACDRCNSKRFSVVADLKSHMKHCGERKWWCSCGTNFSRKDKLFGHMALFEGHMPAVMEDERDKGVLVMVDEDEGDFNGSVKEVELGINCEEKGLFEGLMEGFGSVENYYLQDLLDSPNGGLGSGMNWAL